MLRIMDGPSVPGDEMHAGAFFIPGVHCLIVYWSCFEGRGIMETPQQKIDDERLQQVKEKLKAGRLEPKDLEVLEQLVARTELAAKQLRAAVVE